MLPVALYAHSPPRPAVASAAAADTDAGADFSPSPSPVSYQANFRKITFQGQCSTYRRAACTLALVLAASSAYDVWVFAYGEDAQPERLRVALTMRGVSIGLIGFYCASTYWGSRNLTLWMTVVFMWAIVACYLAVLEQHARVNGRPQENNMNILALVAVYITFMPGTPPPHPDEPSPPAPTRARISHPNPHDPSPGEA